MSHRVLLLCGPPLLESPRSLILITSSFLKHVCVCARFLFSLLLSSPATAYLATTFFCFCFVFPSGLLFVYSDSLLCE